jgi:hypothetical protein
VPGSRNLLSPMWHGASRGSLPMTHILSDGEQSLFWSHVRFSPGCWTWTGAKLWSGYGAVKVNGRTYRAHRVSWELTRPSPIPRGIYVCHVCDNPPCVRPDHLFLGNQRDNIRDASAKGRMEHGPEHRARLSQAIREAYERDPEYRQKISAARRRMARRGGPCP